MITTDTEHRAFLRRLRADLFGAAKRLEREEARYLVDLYYQIQEFRKAAKNQTRAAEEGQEPNALVAWMGTEFRAVEATIKQAMGHYAQQSEVGNWSLGITGVGPVLAAGFVAHLDIAKAPTAGSIWRFAGLDPTVKWERKTKRPWNARVKVLAWKFADCQCKFQNHKNSFYGPLFAEYKAGLIERNEAGDFKEAAAEGAARVGKKTEAYKHYKTGKLPPGHLQSRALRWVAKLFLSHWHAVAYEAHYGEPSPKPYVIASPKHPDHVHMIEVPR